MEIGPAGPEDLPECAELYDRVARDTFTWLPAERQAEKFLAEAKEEEVYVARDAGVILGLAAFYRPANFLHSLYIDAAARGRGVGTLLLAHVEALADGPISLKVQKLNHPAIAFYRSRGLKITEVGGADDPGGGWFRMARIGS